MKTTGIAVLAFASVIFARGAEVAPSIDMSVTGPGHATVRFVGDSTAELYTKELVESLNGVLRYNYISDDSLYPVGFVRASPPTQPWYKTFWTRDGGTFLRE